MKRLEDIDLNLLLLLHWLLEERSVTRAASRVGVSQPAASRGLQRLRDVFSDELLIRSGRGYTLSRLAAAIQGDLARAIQHFRSVAHRDETFSPDTSTENVVIACNDYLSTVCADAWVEAIAPHAPTMRSSWRPLDVSVIESLASGQVDLALIPEVALANIHKSAVSQDMVVKPLLSDQFVVFGPATHPVLIADILSLRMFADADHVLVSPIGEGLGFVDGVLNAHCLERRIIHRTASFNHAADLAIATGGLTVVPERLAALKLNGIYRQTPFETEQLSSNLVWHASRTSDRAHTWVRRQFQAFFKS
jgi:DNA-binding transcriptional LysR family regulator